MHKKGDYSWWGGRKCVHVVSSNFRVVQQREISDFAAQIVTTKYNAIILSCSYQRYELEVLYPDLYFSLVVNVPNR